MKKLLFAGAILLASLNVMSCSPVPLQETLDKQQTVGENESEDEDPNG